MYRCQRGALFAHSIRKTEVFEVLNGACKSFSWWLNGRAALSVDEPFGPRQIRVKSPNIQKHTESVLDIESWAPAKKSRSTCSRVSNKPFFMCELFGRTCARSGWGAPFEVNIIQRTIMEQLNRTAARTARLTNGCYWSSIVRRCSKNGHLR